MSSMFAEYRLLGMDLVRIGEQERFVYGTETVEERELGLLDYDVPVFRTVGRHWLLPIRRRNILISILASVDGPPGMEVDQANDSAAPATAGAEAAPALLADLADLFKSFSEGLEFPLRLVSMISWRGLLGMVAVMSAGPLLFIVPYVHVHQRRQGFAPMGRIGGLTVGYGSNNGTLIDIGNSSANSNATTANGFTGYLSSDEVDLFVHCIWFPAAIIIAILIYLYAYNSALMACHLSCKRSEYFLQRDREVTEWCRIKRELKLESTRQEEVFKLAHKELAMGWIEREMIRKEEREEREVIRKELKEERAAIRKENRETEERRRAAVISPLSGNGATGNGATGNGATGNGATGNGATGTTSRVVSGASGTSGSAGRRLVHRRNEP
ncbi:hypothetical protein BDZ91DRAFT_850105 [Kalaharituber pfeilii]|nr:hypothetical protein BDZ91DRAFT_850105 [Kalaharituber pfeilii]